MTVNEIIREIDRLAPEERKKLIEKLKDTFNKEDISPMPRTRDITEFRGIGIALNDGTNPQNYINEMRDEWDHRP